MSMHKLTKSCSPQPLLIDMVSLSSMHLVSIGGCAHMQYYSIHWYTPYSVL